MSLTIDQKDALNIQRGILKAEDALVKAIQDALDVKASYSGLEEAQFRNLVRVAENTESSEVVINFLRYQVGRERKWGRGPTSLAAKIINDITGLLLKQAKDIVGDAQTHSVSEIHIKLIRRYLGYGARYLKYLNEGQNP